MGTFSTDVVRTTGSESDFFAATYTKIKGLWEDITCDITKWDSGTGDYITITDASTSDWEITKNKYTNADFNLDDGVILRVQILPTNSYYDSRSASSGYNIGLLCGGNYIMSKNIDTASYDTCIEYRASTWTSNNRFRTAYVEDTTTRQHRYTIYTDLNMFILWISPYNASDFKDINGVGIMRIKVTENGVTKWKWAGYAGPNIIDNASIYDADGTNPVTKSSVFSYEARLGYLDYVPNGSFVSGSTKVFQANNIFDCSAVNIGDTFLLDDNHSYMAIGTHSLVPIDYDITPSLIEKTITENGTYSAKDDGADGYSEVVVDVDNWTAIFENGQWLNPEGVSYTISPTGSEYIYIEDGELVYSETTGVSVAAVDQTKYISLKAEFSIVKAESCYMQTGRCVAGADARRCQNEGYERYSWHDYNFPATITTDRSITIMCNNPREGVFLSGNSTTDAIRIKRLSVCIQSDLVAFN